jgi:PAS domain S-box-containing protein
MPQSLKLLIVEDNPADAELLLLELRKAGFDPAWQRVDTETAFLEQLDLGPDLVLSDYQMPRLNGFRALELLKQRGLEVPFILVSGIIGEELAVVAMKNGAADYLLKDRLARLGSAVIHALAETRLRRERRQADELAQRQQAELRVLFDLMPAMVWFKDGKNRILQINRRAAEITGQSVEAIEGRPSFEIYPPGAARFLTDDLKVIQSGVSELSVVETVRDREGRDLWVQTDKVPVRDKEGKMIGIVVMAQDITRRMRADTALRTSEKRFKALFEQAAVGVAQADAGTGRFVQVNQRFCEIVGRSRLEMEQLTFAGLTHPKDLERDQETLRQLNAGTLREATREKRYLRGDHSEVWVNLTVSAMWAPGETPDYIIAVVQDITERKQLEEQFRQAQKMEAIGTLAGGIAHDFNNILAAICGYTELARMALIGNPGVRENLGCVLQASRRATDLVRQILTFSRQQPQERRPIKLLPIVEESLKLLRSTIPSSIEFDTSLATDTPTVLADATQIHQILMNLGTNAWYAMKDRSGRLQVRLERWEVDAPQAAIEPRLRPGLYARISIRDTGCGMDQPTLRRIFEPFFTTKPPGEGTGLGLAVVHGIMDTHDGAVTVHSQPGEGTVFQFYFPAHVGIPLQDPSHEGPVPRGQGEMILVIDDEAMITHLIRQALVGFGYKVESATEPAAALALVRADPQRFALVLTDQTMPGMTGLLLASLLHKIRPELPVIMMTGYSAGLMSERVEAAGIRQILLKPITIHALGIAVHAALTAAPPIAPSPE